MCADNSTSKKSQSSSDRPKKPTIAKKSDVIKLGESAPRKK